ncbi:MAG TPA: hypothetical protein PLG90_13375 [Ignavibacteria bacterium]|nr:hypothetical protein [Ignavibacteria bacterium]
MPQGNYKSKISKPRKNLKNVRVVYGNDTYEGYLTYNDGDVIEIQIGNLFKLFSKNLVKITVI